MSFDTEDRKRVLIPVGLANKVIEDGPQEFGVDGNTIVLGRDDIPHEAQLTNCCLRSQNMLDHGTYNEVCTECGRIFDIHHNRVRFDPNRTGTVVAFVPKSEFVG